MPLYKVEDLISMLITQYEITNETSKDAIRHEIAAVCKEIPDGKNKTKTLWDVTLKKGGKQKRGVRMFTEYQRQQIFSHPRLYKYVTERSGNKDIIDAGREAIKGLEEIEKNKQMSPEDLDKKCQNYVQQTLKELIEEEDISYLLDHDLPQKQLELMVKALYLMFYEPIDTVKLYHDMNMAAVPHGRLPTAESIFAKKRLEDPTYYCKRKQEQKDQDGDGQQA